MTNLYAPAQLLMPSNIKNIISFKYSLKPKLVRFKNYINQILFNNKYISYYNKNTNQLSKLKVNNKILFKIKSNSTWIPGEVINICDQLRLAIFQPNSNIIIYKTFLENNSQPATKISFVVY